MNSRVMSSKSPSWGSGGRFAIFLNAYVEEGLVVKLTLVRRPLNRAATLNTNCLERVKELPE